MTVVIPVFFAYPNKAHIMTNTFETCGDGIGGLWNTGAEETVLEVDRNCYAQFFE